jgi:hypothetical protein
MKKIVILFLAIVLNSCNDGNFEVPSFEFTETINSCGAYILYRTNTDKTEVLTLVLSSDEINTIVQTKPYSISSATPVNYRIFDSAIGTDYFCQTIPPASPNVLKELSATSGEINITTTANADDNGVIVSYTYDITLTNLLFNDNTGKIFYETYPFGSITINN